MSNTISEIRANLEACKGHPVHLYAVGERNRILDTYGVLDGVYNDIFTVTVDNEHYQRRYCYTYTEILMRNVQVKPVTNLV